MPEVAALAERLDAASRGGTLLRVEPISFHALRSVTDVAALSGSRIAGVSHRGKYLIVSLGERRIVITFAQGGRLDVEIPARPSRPRGALARFVLRDGAAWLLREWGTERRAGWWVLDSDDQGPLASLGPDADDPAAAEWLRTAEDRRHLHTSLRDQRTIAGLGRGWTDDILHLARLSPFASLASLDVERRESLVRAIADVLAGALTRERERTGGLPAKLGDRFAIHNRAGTPCPACGSDLRRVSYADREVTYCPTCQTNGKVLADRRMSRLIR